MIEEGLRDIIEKQLDKAEIRGEDRLIVHDWVMESVIRDTILEGIWEGNMEIAEVKDGEPLFGLTEQGRQAVEEMGECDSL